MSLIKAGLPPPSPAPIAQLRGEASAAMVAFGQRIRDDFRNARPARMRARAASPATPGDSVGMGQS